MTISHVLHEMKGSCNSSHGQPRIIGYLGSVCDKVRGFPGVQTACAQLKWMVPSPIGPPSIMLRCGGLFSACSGNIILLAVA